MKSTIETPIPTPISVIARSRYDGFSRMIAGLRATCANILPKNCQQNLGTGVKERRRA